MKYRLFEGGYESFLDHRVPEEYQDVVVDDLPPELIVDPLPTVDEIAEIKKRLDDLEKRRPQSG